MPARLEAEAEGRGDTCSSADGGDTAATQMKLAANPMSRRTQTRSKPTGFRPVTARPVQNAQQNYERYLALARAQVMAGDHIAAENYFQHAEHYLRSMRESGETARAARH